MITRLLASLWLVCVFSLWAEQSVVINEIMYHPADDQDALQYIELHNVDSAAADLSGWSLDTGGRFVFPAGTSISPHGFLVVVRDTNAFRRAYGNTIPALGNLAGRLKHRGEKVQLLDRGGLVVDKLKYSDQPPWAFGADGYGSSLERICPVGPAADPHNWAASNPVRGKPAAGTPGRENDNYSPKLLPVIDEVTFESFPKPGQPIAVSAAAKGTQGVTRVVLRYKIIKPGRPAGTAEVPMKLISGHDHAGRYEATIPPATDGSLIRFDIQAAERDGPLRVEPSPSEPRSEFSAYVTEPIARAQIPIVKILNAEALRGGGGNRKFGPPQHDSGTLGNSALVYIPTKDDPAKPQLFDFVRVRRRAGGWKVHFFKDHLLDGMSSINLIFEGPPRWVLSEYLSYELYRRAGVPAEKSGHFRLSIDGRAYGYYLYVEQPNKNFLARNHLNEAGNLYKILWHQQGVVAQHEKKTNPGSGHSDIASLVQGLNKKSAAAQYAFINEQFDLKPVINYFAVNMCIQNWDGFFNNYFAFHDTSPNGKWLIIPWDEDKTWGEYDGGPGNYAWYDMPLTVGMNGDPAQRGDRGWFGGGGPFGGGANWWRPPGYFSGPLLANPQFRKQFEERLRELCTTVFTEEAFGPVVRDLQQRLRPEVELRAQVTREDVGSALRHFDADIDSFHRQLANRSKFILKQLSK